MTASISPVPITAYYRRGSQFVGGRPPVASDLAAFLAEAGPCVLVNPARGWPVTGSQWPLLAFAIVIPAMIVYKHRGNIARLRAGTESRFARRT